MCLAAFMALGVAPTLLIAAWCAARHLPGRAAAEAARLCTLLGTSVTLEDVEYPAPGVLRYRGLQVANPETLRPVLRCGVLDAAWDSQTTPTPMLGLTVSGLEVEAAEADELGRLVGCVLQSRGGQAEPNIRLSAGQVVLRFGAAEQSLGNVQGVVKTYPGDRVESWLAASCGNAQDATPARLRIVRSRQSSPPTYGFEIDAREAALPCSLLALGLPEMRRLGTSSRFQGYLRASLLQEGWTGELAGRLTNVDLGGLMDQWSAHRLTGTAQLTIDQARFRCGRWEQGVGQLEAGPGVVGRSLLAAATLRLGLTSGVRPAQVDPAPYERLCLRFCLDAQGLWLQGQSGVVLADQTQCLLGDPQRQPQSAIALLQALMPEGETPLAVNRQSVRMLEWLPVPEAVTATIGNGEQTVSKQ